MNSLRDLLHEYDQLGDAGFSSPHDFTLRQRKLENWAIKARDAIAELLGSPAGLQDAEDGMEDDRRPLKRTGS